MPVKLTPLSDGNVCYDLRRNVAAIERMQAATLSPGPWGVTNEQGLIGSPQWWTALENGVIVLEAVEGVVSTRLLGKGDFRVVEITSADGIQSWSEWDDFDESLVGQKIRAKYVLVAPKNSSVHKPEYRVPVLVQVELLEPNSR